MKLYKLKVISKTSFIKTIYAKMFLIMNGVWKIHLQMPHKFLRLTKEKEKIKWSLPLTLRIAILILRKWMWKSKKEWMTRFLRKELKRSSKQPLSSLLRWVTGRRDWSIQKSYWFLWPNWMEKSKKWPSQFFNWLLKFVKIEKIKTSLIYQLPKSESSLKLSLIIQLKLKTNVFYN